MAILLLFLLLAACARTTLQSSVVDEFGGAGEIAEMDFWDGLAAQPAVSNHDALHALLLSFGGDAKGYDARLREARRRGWVDDDLPRDETARVGWIARAICIEAKIEGGVTMRLFGPSERYATNELDYREWLPGMSRRQSISGAQLISLLSDVEDHLGATGEPGGDL